MRSRRQFLRLSLAALAASAAAARRAGPTRASSPHLTYLPLARSEPLTPQSPPGLPPPPVVEGAIVAPASGTAGQANAWFAPRALGYMPYDVSVIIGRYQQLGDWAGVDWFLALAQMAHETGSLTSWWSQRPRRNPAGIGVTGATRPGDPGVPPGAAWAWDDHDAVWREGVSFATWVDDAVPAHLGRLLAYAVPAGQETPEQASLITAALGYRGLPAGYRGSAPTVLGLNGRWAVPGDGYGEAILDLARRMRGEETGA
jgi:hypothetical protein